MYPTLHEMRLLALCQVTYELLDVKKFLLGFCDGILLSSDEKNDILKRLLSEVKKELNSFRVQKKFFDGYKAVVLSNMDKIINLVQARFQKMYPREVENILASLRDFMKKILNATDFEKLVGMDAKFKREVLLPIYELHLKQEKKRL